MSILTFEAIEKAYGRTVALRGVSYRKENKVVVLRASTDADLLAWWEIVAALVVLGDRRG